MAVFCTQGLYNPSGQFNCLFYDCFRFYNKRKVVVPILGTTKSTKSQNERLFRQPNMNFL